jgi:undecaprenyl-diphosphatase
MNYVYAALAGVIQGLTEFLPVSSSGHLLLFHDLFGFQVPDEIAFDVVLHLGTLTALLAFFWQDVIRYLRAFFTSFGSWRGRLANLTIDQRIAWYLVIATIPGAAFGFLLEDQIDAWFRNPTGVAIMLIVFGVVLYVVDRFAKKERTMDQLGFGGAIGIGLAQVLALVPGVSRSGITMIAGLAQKLNRDAAARFSFLLSMPIIFGAGAKKVIDLVQGPALSSAMMTEMLIGFVTSAVVGYFCIRYFLQYIRRHSLSVFVWYRIVVGVAVLVYLGFAQ